MGIHFDKKRLITSLISALLLIILTASVLKWRTGNINNYSQAAFIMGTVFSLDINSYGDDPTGDLIAIGNRLEHDLLSHRISDSEISLINGNSGTPEGYPLTAEMEEILTTCLQISADSNGAFDITIGALTDLWDIDGWASGENDGEFIPPSADMISDALSHCGYEKVRIEDHRIYMPEGMKLDLGAIGKGIYLDECRSYIQENQTTNDLSGIIAAGGSILTLGEKEGGWTIGITDPFNSGEIYDKLSVSGYRNTSTSGSYERFVEYRGVRYHHIINPLTGYPTGCAEDNNKDYSASVTIISDSGLMSDALSTACFVLGETKGRELAKKYGADIYVIPEK